MADVEFHLGAYKRFINRVVQPYLRSKAEEIAAEARRNAPVGATNQLRNSISVTPLENGRVRISVGADHAGYVTQGTGPGATPPRPAYFPRLRRRGLILWSDAKNANPGAVAHGISVKGTPANSYFEDSIQKILSRLDFRWFNKDLK